MPTNVEVTKNNNENPVSLLRRFTKRVQGSGILNRMRSNRYHERALSKYKTKMKTLESIRRREERVEQIKLGKINPDASRKGSRA